MTHLLVNINPMRIPVALPQTTQAHLVVNLTFFLFVTYFLFVHDNLVYVVKVLYYDLWNVSNIKSLEERKPNCVQPKTPPNLQSSRETNRQSCGPFQDLFLYPRGFSKAIFPLVEPIFKPLKVK